jgi:hypothetical protein
MRSTPRRFCSLTAKLKAKVVIVISKIVFVGLRSIHLILLPSLPSLVTLLERLGREHLAEEDRRQLLAMSVSTAERLLRAQRKPRLHGLSNTTPGQPCKALIPVRMFSQWEEDRPGFVEMDLVAHCGEHLGGSFL